MNFASVCTGIGGFDLAFENAGFTPLWFCENNTPCQDVLRKHWPTIYCHDNLLDRKLDTAPKPDVLCGGTPCQGFSVAGLRGSLEDERSNLCLRFVKLADALDPEFVLWENVPGVLSMSDNAFGCFLAGLVGADAPLVPPANIPLWKHGKRGQYFAWPSAGVVAGPKRSLAWRVFDSQFFGVAQRRARVFVVADRGTGRSAQILFESKSRGGNHSTSQETRERLARTLSPSLSASGRGTARAGESRGQDCLIPSVAHAVVCHATKGGDPTTDNYVVSHQNTGHGYWKESQVAQTVRTPDGGGSQEATLITHSLKSEGADASEDGTGRGTPLIAATLRSGSSNEASHNKPSGMDENLIAYRTSGNCGVMKQGDKTAALNTATDPNQNIVAFHQNASGEVRESGTGFTVSTNSNASGRNTSIARTQQGVRRLMPVECERLQAFPDGWTKFAVDSDGREYEQSDSARYKQLGNAVTVNVVEWIARRI